MRELSMEVLLALLVALLVSHGATAAAQEPGLEGRTDIVLIDGFEAADWYTAWGRSEAPRNTTIETDGAFGGSSHLRVSVPAGEHYGTSFKYDFVDMGMAPPAEMHFRYSIRLGPTWTTDGGGGGKLPGFGATYDTAGWGGRPSDGTNGWSARMLFWQPESGRDTGATRIGYYAYHADMTGTYGANWFWSGGPIGPGGALEVGRWYQIECYVRNNTPGENDGVLRGWVDGVMVYEKTDVKFRDVERLHLENIWFDIYYGGSWVPPRDMYVDFDNVVIARNYIGPTVDEPPPILDGGAPPSDSGVDSGSPPGDSGPPAPDTGVPPGTDSGVDTGSGPDEDVSGGCGCRAMPTSRDSTPVAAWLGCVAAIAWARRRRRG